MGVTLRPLDLVKIRSLQITPYHPIKISHDGSWVFPISCNDGVLVKSDSNSVYNLVLEERSRHKAIMMENLYPSITLGHGIKNNDVLTHEYFGTESVVHDLKKFESAWLTGHIILKEENIKRNDETGNISSISSNVKVSA